MRLNWLKAKAFEVSYVNRPAIDKRFIAIKAMDDDGDKTFADRIGTKIKNKFGFVDTKVGRVLSKANESKLLDAAGNMIKAGETIQAVLASINKNAKEELSMDEVEVKKIIAETIKEQLEIFKAEQKSEEEAEDKETELQKLKDQLEDLQKKIDGDEEEEDEEEDESSKKSKKKVSKKEESDEDEDEEDDEDEEEDDEDDESEEEEEDSELLDGVEKIVDKKFKEVKSEIDGIKKELKIKPKSDRKEKKNKKSEDGDEEADYTGAFGIEL